MGELGPPHADRRKQRGVGPDCCAVHWKRVRRVVELAGDPVKEASANVGQGWASRHPGWLRGGSGA